MFKAIPPEVAKGSSDLKQQQNKTFSTISYEAVSLGGRLTLYQYSRSISQTKLQGRYAPKFIKQVLHKPEV